MKFRTTANRTKIAFSVNRPLDLRAKNLIINLHKTCSKSSKMATTACKFSKMSGGARPQTDITKYRYSTNRTNSVGNSNSIFLLPFVIIWFKNCRSAASGSLNVLKLFVCKLGYFSW